MTEQAANASREWNYHSDLPLEDPSVFRWPPRPGYLARWILTNWLTLSERVMMVLLAVLVWYVFFPSLEAMQSFAVGWIAQIWVVNIAMMVIVGGGCTGISTSAGVRARRSNSITGIRPRATGCGILPTRCMTTCSGR